MDTVMNTLVGVIALMLTGLGMMSMFAPKKMLANFSLEPIGKAGMNTIRSVMGGLFLASVYIIATGLLNNDTDGYFFVAVVMLAVAAGRVVGLVLDGFDKAVVPPLVLELVIASILLFVHMKHGGFY
ncbi:hypothetical protein VFDL14_11380 [Vibrio fortis]|uniref:DUF4345 domain-containing protein n=1 Tax=Vibrio fortis TaxID=212667 RepID=A0A066UHC3_9VIBR|nr:DUF4345 family protein [Vibrio fortis]KDN26480.1 hypothetical protein VFDL14_11380 [Vibrio fortis]